jgi:PKD repeat protein
MQRRIIHGRFMRKHRVRRVWEICVLAAAVVTTAGCGLGDQSTPPLSGPSSFGTSVTMTAAPDRLTQDGVSKTTITAVVQDASGKGVKDLAVQWAVTPSDGTTFVEPSWRTSLTDANGATNVQVTAPPAPSGLPTSPLTLTISATPLSDNTANAAPRLIEITLVPPIGTLPENRAPVAAFTVVPAVTNINQRVDFDASTTTDEGSPCGSRCVYRWDFGDFSIDDGVGVNHKYTLPGTYNVTLTVRDSRGAVHSTAKALIVSGPAAPVAQFTVTPSTATFATTFAFSAAASTVGAGATIDRYLWDFGDGETADGIVPAKTHKYNAPGTYIVTLTITDSLQRTAIRTAPLVVAPVVAPPGP